MQLPVDEITKEQLANLSKIFNKALQDSRMPSALGTPEDVEAALSFLLLIKQRNSVIMDALHKTEITTEKESSDRLSPYEKSIQTIVKSDLIDKILYPEKKKQNWMNNKFLTFLNNVLPDTKDIASTSTAKGIYEKHRAVYANRISRMKKSPKIAVLTEKYPDFDVHTAIALGILSDKLDTSIDDLNFIDQFISVLTRNKR